ncbi:hypothetical protein H2200_011877 [Cladophialophora chaetospira]|uniref:BTB domain-containing protein n=1 Tax=Cladophialophora chaetospira TaxID=386627 RepID=A0AA38WYX2_9EURO|nr:hypothetical protein H2200_011877 [Cladophialophora chaetospira]
MANVTRDADAEAYSSFATSPLIKIVVGDAQIEFHVHKDVLVTETVFFQRILSNSTPGAETKEVKLPDVDPAIFKYFVNWVYTRAAKTKRNTYFDQGYDNIHPENIDGILETWRFAEDMGMPGWQHYLVRALGSRMPASCVGH